MSSRRRDDIDALAQLAADAGPALVPVGHRELLLQITDTAKRLFSAMACSLALLTEDEEELEFIVASGAGAEAVKEMRIPANQGIAGWVVMSGQAIAVDDVAADARFAAGVAATTGYVPRSIIAMPLQTERRVLGVIEVLDPGGRPSSTLSDMELLSLFAGLAALAIEASAMFSDLGRVLLESLAEAGVDRELAARLRRVAETAPRPRHDLAEATALLRELGQAGDGERRLAVRVLRDVLAFARERGPA
jgi:GAF domain-containing protein